MLINNTIDKLNQLKLHGLAKALQDQMSNSSVYSLSFEERLSLLVDQEQSHRDNLRLERLLKAAKLKSVGACVFSSKRATHNQPKGPPRMSFIRLRLNYIHLHNLWLFK